MLCSASRFYTRSVSQSWRGVEVRLLARWQLLVLRKADGLVMHALKFPWRVQRSACIASRS